MPTSYTTSWDLTESQMQAEMETVNGAAVPVEAVRAGFDRLRAYYDEYQPGTTWKNACFFTCVLSL
jgi:hypothetical protein